MNARIPHNALHNVRFLIMCDGEMEEALKPSEEDILAVEERN
jgi:hypothetical protein